MIRVICNYGVKGALYFDCDGHATHESDRCVEMSTICSMLVRYCAEDFDILPTECRDGKVTFNIDPTNERINEVFRAAMTEITALAEEHPKDIRVY